MNPQILKDHIQDYIKYDKKLFDKIAFGIDIRTGLKSFEEIPYLQKEIEKLGYPLKTFFLKSSASSIIKRYNNTRRKHPLASAGLTLQESLDKERKAFSKVINEKIEIIDTSKTNIYQLRDIIINKVSKKVNLSIVSIKSFGYKFGIPEDADFIFDDSLKNKSNIGNIVARLTVSNIIAIIEKMIRIKNCFFCLAEKIFINDS